MLKDYTYHEEFEKKIEQAHEIMVLTIMATNEGSGEPAHLYSLSRAFAVRTLDVWK